MFRSPTPVAPVRVLAIGKFAGHPEFLRAEGGGEALEAFDEWVERGSVAAHERWGRQWSTTFPMGAAHGFLWGSTQDQTCLCGVIAPSRDAVGRDYPLAVAASFQGAFIARAPHIVPLAFGEFLDAAYNVIDEARTTPMSVDGFTRRLQAIAGASVDDLLRAEAEYSTWSRSTPLEQGWGAIFPGFAPLEKATRALEVIGAALTARRGQVTSSEVPLVLRLPLGTGGVAAAVLWFDIVRRLCQGSSIVPSAFWGLDDGMLLVPLGRAPSSAFGELWRPDPGNDGVCDIAGLVDAQPPSSAFRGMPATPPPAMPMASFLDGLGR